MTDQNSQNKYKRSTDKKKEAVLGKAKKSRRYLVIALAAGVLLGGGAAAFLGIFSAGRSPANVSAASQARPDTTKVTFPAAVFEDGKARHYTYPAGDKRVRYFVLKSSDGVIRAAFDACDVCWPAGKGYYQDGDAMVCRNCGRRFASHLINEVKGGCNPAPLKRTVQDGQLVIRVEDILQGQAYFDFSGRG